MREKRVIEEVHLHVANVNLPQNCRGWCFSLFFSPSSQKRYGRGFNMVNDVQAGLSSRTYPERWLTTSLWDGSFAFNEPAKRRNLLKGLG